MGLGGFRLLRLFRCHSFPLEAIGDRRTVAIAVVLLLQKKYREILALTLSAVVPVVAAFVILLLL